MAAGSEGATDVTGAAWGAGGHDAAGAEFVDALDAQALKLSSQIEIFIRPVYTRDLPCAS